MIMIAVRRAAYFVFIVIFTYIGYISLGFTNTVNANQISQAEYTVHEFLGKYLESNIVMDALHRSFVHSIYSYLDNYSNELQDKIVEGMVEKMRYDIDISKALAVFGINTSKIVDVLEASLQWSKKRQGGLIYGEGSDDETYGVSYKVYPFLRNASQRVVVFDLESEHQILRATRHWPDGSTYTCKFNRCTQIPKVRDVGNKYKVDIYINYGRNIYGDKGYKKEDKKTIFVDL